MGRRVVITQSNYLPWRGYFDMIASADDFVIYDTVQYTKRDWRNRNRIRIGDKSRWLSVPVLVGGRYEQRVRDTQIADRNWWRSHLSILEASYRDLPAFRTLQGELQELYASLAGLPLLSTINVLTLQWLCELLGIRTVFHDAVRIPHHGDPTERLVQIASHLGATTYVTGPAARAYLDERLFSIADIEVEYFDYSTLPADPGALPVANGELSVIDLVARCGAKAAKLIPCARRWDPA